MENLLDIQGLSTCFRTASGLGWAVDGADLDVRPGETLGLVGESGCGKSILALSVLRLVPDPPGRVASGRVLFRGRDLLTLSEADLRGIRGNRISMIFQEPMTALNPVLRVGEQIAEGVRLHRGLGRRESLDYAAGLLAKVGMPEPRARLRSFPHELSGGQRQRVMIAAALACGPELILADEPTTALDVTIQAQILDLMAGLQESEGASVLLITHDLGVVARTCARVAVMYAGRIVERAGVRDIFAGPLHPYTAGLLDSLPRGAAGRPGGRLRAIPGQVPGLFAMPPGCAFHPRCARALPRCATERPPMFGPPERQARCWLYADQGLEVTA